MSEIFLRQIGRQLAMQDTPKPFDEQAPYNSLTPTEWSQMEGLFANNVKVAYNYPPEALVKGIKDNFNVFIEYDNHSSGAEEDAARKYFIKPLSDRAHNEQRKFLRPVEGINADNDFSRKALSLLNEKSWGDIKNEFKNSKPGDKFWDEFKNTVRPHLPPEKKNISDGELKQIMLGNGEKFDYNLRHFVISRAGYEASSKSEKMTSMNPRSETDLKEILEAKENGTIFLPLPSTMPIVEGQDLYYYRVIDGDKYTRRKVDIESYKKGELKYTDKLEVIGFDQFCKEYNDVMNQTWADLIEKYLTDYSVDGREPIIYAKMGYAHAYSGTGIKGIDERLEEKGIKYASVSCDYNNIEKDNSMFSGFGSNYYIQVAKGNNPVKTKN